MVDERTDYRPAGSRDFARAVNNVDASDLRPSAPPPTYAANVGDRTTDDNRVNDARRADDAAYDARVGERTTSYDEGRRGASGYDARTRDRTYDNAAAPAAVATPTPDLDRDRRYVDRPASTTVHERVDRPVGDRPFSVAAGFFGWAVASFFTLVLGTLVLALIGSAAYDATDGGATGVTQDAFNDLTTGGIIGLLVALFVAYFLGGYAAGRIGLWHGVGHGVAVVAWTVLFTILTIALGAWLGDAVAGLNLVPAIDWADLTGPALAGILGSLLAMLAGAILGAKLGTRPYGIDGVNEGRGHRAWRGRPL